PPSSTHFPYTTLFRSQENGPKHIRKFKLSGDGATLSGGEVFAECDNGLFDGFRVDTEGRLWSSAGDGVHVFDPDGTLLGKFLVRSEEHTSELQSRENL